METVQVPVHELVQVREALIEARDLLAQQEGLIALAWLDGYGAGVSDALNPMTP